MEEMGTLGSQQGGATPIYQDGSVQSGWSDDSYNVQGSQSLSKQTCNFSLRRAVSARCEPQSHVHNIPQIDSMQLRMNAFFAIRLWQRVSQFANLVLDH